MAGAAQFEPLSAAGGGSPGGYFEALTGFGEGQAGSEFATGIGYFEALTASGSAIVPYTGDGVATFEAMEAVGYGPTFGELTFEPLTASGVGNTGGIGIAAFQPLTIETGGGAASFLPLAAMGVGQVVISNEFTTKIVNLRTGAVTEFSNHAFNSFARIGTSYYGAGPTGLVRLSGVTDPSNAPINWHVKTGQMDDKDVGLKRLPEVVLGLRSNGKINVRVHPNDVTSYTYQLPVVQTNTIHQHRVQPGRGMRSRWFAVALLGVENATLELDSMQVNMTKTTRRLG